MSSLTFFYSFFGALGLLIFGIKLYSESLHSLFYRKIQRASSNLGNGVMKTYKEGFILGSILNSSISSCFHTMSLQNASLISLKDGLVLLVSTRLGNLIPYPIINGYLSGFGLFIMGAAIFPLIFATNTRLLHFLKSLFGVGMFLYGIELMKYGLMNLDPGPIGPALGVLNNSILYSILFGLFFSLIIQSSIVSYACFYIFYASGIWQLNTVMMLLAGMVLASSLRPLLAVKKLNQVTKKLGDFHLIYNLLFLLISIIFYFIFESKVILGFSSKGLNLALYYIGLHGFNGFICLLLLPLIIHFLQLKVDANPHKEYPKLISLGRGQEQIPASSISLARAGIVKFSTIVGRMMLISYNYLKSSKRSPRALAKIKDYERIADNIQGEVQHFLQSSMQRPLTSIQAKELSHFMQISNELEKIADYLDKFGTNLTNFLSLGDPPKSCLDELLLLFADIQAYYNQVIVWFEPLNPKKANELMKVGGELKLRCDELRWAQVEKLHQIVAPSSLLIYSDMVVNLRKIRAHTQSIVFVVEKGFST